MAHEGPRVPSLGLGRGFPWLDRGLDVSLTSFLATSRHGKESGKWQEGRVTWLDTKGSRYPRGSGYGNLEKTGLARRLRPRHDARSGSLDS
ncbi:hypothetical protein CRG98_003747 [Punica granatum]|uniref:Uncharacterized protein n=1 Tax=Punica granatum TaxID=22663 RepID=A0A2I0L562_PUNGR|nr:hypothetical protein CRG98_003747 [Punica granatum]